MSEVAAPDLDIYTHVFHPATAADRPPLLLLHRTGGNEDDLVSFVQTVSPGSPMLALRGNVLEDGRPRFFRRVGKGNFDIADLERRTAGLDHFLVAACRHYGIAPPVAIGHSNGANIVWSLMFAGTRHLSGAVLLRPMLAYEPERVANLSGFPVLILSGRRDEVVTSDRAEMLPAACAKAGADVAHVALDATHDRIDDDEAVAAEWLARMTSRFRPSILRLSA